MGRAWLVLVPLAMGCSEETAPAPVTEEPAPTTDGWRLGQPTSTVLEAEGPFTDSHTYLASVMLPGGDAFAVGARGVRVVDPATGTEEFVDDAVFGEAVASDEADARAWVVTSPLPGVVGFDVSDPTAPVEVASWDVADPPQRIAAADGIVLVGTIGAAELFDTDGNPVSTLPVSSSYGVALRGGRALVAEEDSLVLYDVSVPASPVELSRAPLAGSGFDIAFDGTHVVVALGGSGIDFLEVEDDVLVPTDHLDLASSTYSVTLDGGDVWASAWTFVALIALDGPGDGGAAVLGYEPTSHFAFGVSARDGRAFVDELEYLQTIDRVDGYAGPEVEVPPTLWLDPTATAPIPLAITNEGALPLHYALAGASGWSVDPVEVVLQPGEDATIEVTPVGTPTAATLTWTSDDPDEPTGSVKIEEPSALVGQPQPMFQAPSFVWPDPTLTSSTRDMLYGKVTLMVYFRTDCPICAVTVPDIDTTMTDLFGDVPDFEVVLVNEDNLGFEPAWRFVDTLEISRPVIIDRDFSIYASYAGVGETVIVPMHVVIDRDGIVTWYSVESDVDAITTAVEAALAESP